MEAAWTQKAACGVFVLPGGHHLFTRVALVDRESEGELQFYHWGNGSCAVSSKLDLGVNWGADGSDRRTTRAGILPLTGGVGAVDPKPFATLAYQAVSALVDGV